MATALAAQSKGPLSRGVILDNTSRKRQKGLQKFPVFKSQSHKEGALLNIFPDSSSEIHRQVTKLDILSKFYIFFFININIMAREQNYKGRSISLRVSSIAGRRSG